MRCLRGGLIMKACALATLMTLVLASSAHASVWELAWTSEWMGMVLAGDPPEITTESSFASGESTATITPTTYGVQVRFDTDAGRAQLGVDREFIGPDSGRAFLPGSGPDSGLRFSGTGVRAVAAPEPGVLVMTLMALGALLALGRSGDE
jgi:hypothetical protein